MELADVIAQLESNGNQYAQRFERLHLGASSRGLLARIATANKCSSATADVFAAMSHGLYQIMGFRLYGDPSTNKKNLGYTGSIASFLAQPTTQKILFYRYCEQSEILFSIDELITDAVKRAKFAEVYNGPENVSAYSTRILAAIRLGMPVFPA